MKFEFTFEKLLEHKRSLENVARRDASEAKGAVDAAIHELDQMYSVIDQSRVRAGKIESQGGKQAAFLGQIDEFIGGQKIRIERQREKLRSLLTVAEEKQEVLIRAARETKTLEKLKERRIEEFKRQRKKLEQKNLDELIVMRFGRSDEG